MIKNVHVTKHLTERHSPDLEQSQPIYVQAGSTDCYATLIMGQL